MAYNIKDVFFDQITQDDATTGAVEIIRDKVFAFFDPLTVEVLICYPSQGSKTTTLASLVSTGTTATGTLPAGTALHDGATVTVAGADQGDYNGDFVVTMTGATTFTYTMGGDPVDTATGAITVTSAPYCDKAIVWNTQTQQWSKKDLAETYYMNVGIINEEITTLSWDGTNPLKWNNINMTWASEPANYADTVLVAGSGTTKFFRANDGETADGTPFTTRVEKVGIQPVDTQNFVTEMVRLIPLLSGSGTVDIYTGAEYVKNAGPVWSEATTFTIGVDEFIPVRTQGRYHSVRFESTADHTWILDGYTFEGNLGGDR